MMKFLRRYKLRSDDRKVFGDNNDLTLTSSVSLQQHPQPPTTTTTTTKDNGMLTKRTSFKDQQLPRDNKQTQQRKRSVTNVKPCEKVQMHQQKWHHNQPQQKCQLLLHPPHNNDNNDNKSDSKNHRRHITGMGRRIRRPPLWMGNYDKAQAETRARASKDTSNMRWYAKAKHPTHMQGGSNNNNNNNKNEGINVENAKNDATHRRFVCKSGLLAKAKSFIIEFLQDSSIHGFVYLAKIGLSFIERTLWFAFICVALFSIISLSRRTWHRFQTSPMVISMDRNKLVWNTSFPSLTVCPHKRIDEYKVEEYMLSHPDVFVTDQDKEGFKDFIEKLARLSYDNIEQLPMNKTYGIRGENYIDLLYELKWQFEPEISSGAAVKMHIYETQTEFGICHSVNSLVARYNSYEYRKNNEWHIMDHGERVTVHPLDGEIYAQIINLSTAYDVYFHSSGDIPSITKQRYTFPETDYTTVELIALEISTSDAAKQFSPKQRQCRFQYESDGMMTTPIYTFGLCLAECRMFLALKMCRCIPHFYRNTLRNGRVLPICDIKGLRCVASLKSEMKSLKSSRFKIDCKCLANCDDSNFFVQSYRSRVWFLGANLQWGIIDYPKMQLRRGVLFSFADVLVYIGGLVGFFLGCSALSFTEILYYFTIRFAKRLFN